jgi:colicin import membrane protein
MSAYALEKTNIPQRNLPLPSFKTRSTTWYDLPKTQKKDRPGWIPPEITDNWDTNPYAYQTEEEQMPQGGPHGQLSSYLSELLRSYLEKQELMLLFDSFMLYRDQSGIKQRIGPDLLLMPLQKPAPSSYDLDIEPPPSLLVEITSPESHDKDLDENVSLYASLGIKTYLVIDLMVPHQDQVREQIELHLFERVKGRLVEKSPDHEGYLTLPEMGLKIKAEAQQIILVDKLTGEVLLDVTELKEALESEVEKAKEAKRQALYEKQRVTQEAQRANAAEQRAQTEAKRAVQEKQRAQTEAKRAEQEKQRAQAAELKAEQETKRANVAEQRAQVALKEGEQKKALETARKMLADGLDSAMISKYTGLTLDELATLK